MIFLLLPCKQKASGTRRKIRQQRGRCGLNVESVIFDTFSGVKPLDHPLFSSIAILPIFQAAFSIGAVQIVSVK